jgi:hypothetical protein
MDFNAYNNVLPGLMIESADLLVDEVLPHSILAKRLSVFTF